MSKNNPGKFMSLFLCALMLTGTLALVSNFQLPTANAQVVENNVIPGKIVIKKFTNNILADTFEFTIDGPSSSTQSVTTTNGIGGTFPIPVIPGLYNISETAIPDWALSSATCSNGDSPDNLTVESDEIVVCKFYNLKATRTIGFWGTHVDAAAFVLGATSTSVDGDNSLSQSIITGGTTSGKVIDDLSSYFGAFFSGISKNTDGTSRTALNQAKMQLTQQTIAAIMNCEAFGTIPTATYEGLLLINPATCNVGPGTATGKYLNTVNAADRTKVLAVASLLNSFNNSGDLVPTNSIPLGADPQLAKSLAGRIYDDTLYSGTETGLSSLNGVNGLSGFAGFDDKYWSDFNGGTAADGYGQPFDI